MGIVNARVNGFYRSVYRVSFLVSANDVVAHLQRYYLLIVEDVFYNNNASISVLVSIFVGVLLLLSCPELADTNPYSELLAAVRTLKD